MTGTGATGSGTAAALVAAGAEVHARSLTHPFVRGVADGTLPEADFERWLVADHLFVVEFRRFLAAVLALAPDEDHRDVLAGGLAALTPELALFRRELAARGLPAVTDDAADPSPVCLAYTSYLRAAPLDGYPVALAVLHAVEHAYLDVWRSVRAEAAAAGSPYLAFVANWSSDGFAGYVAELARLLGDGAPTAGQLRAQARVAALELAFWDAG
ncbi:thiaminase II [Rhodococcus aerolatus]